MEEFNTLEKVKELFWSVNCEGNENCYFIAFKNSVKAKSGFKGGMEYPYNALLINATENGLGIFYLNPEKITDFLFAANISKLKITENSYFLYHMKILEKLRLENLVYLIVK